MRAGRNLSIDGQVGQEDIDIVIIHLGRMAPLLVTLVVKPEEPLGPLDVGLFGAQRHMEHACLIPDLIEQFRCTPVGRITAGHCKAPYYSAFSNNAFFWFPNISQATIDIKR